MGEDDVTVSKKVAFDQELKKVYFYLLSAAPACRINLMNDLEWTLKYGDVVWAKAKSFSWWPCYIYDPLELPPLADKTLQKRAIDCTGKLYSIYYYGDGNFGFAKPVNIKPYNAENTAVYAKQTISKKYQHSFQLSIPLADAELMLSKTERVSWHNKTYQRKSKKDNMKEKSPKLKDHKPPSHNSLDDDVLLFDLSEEDEKSQVFKIRNKPTELAVDSAKLKGAKRKSTVGNDSKHVDETESEEEQDQVWFFLFFSYFIN